MPTIDQVLSKIKTNREEFASAFYQAQVGLDQRILLMAVTNENDDKKAFKQALQYAQGKQWLDQLIDSLIQQGLSEGLATLFAMEKKAKTPAKKSKAAKSPKCAGGFDLQAITNKTAAFMKPELLYRGMENGIKWTGKVLIDNQAVGTGVLIGPHLFLTAWHVVQTLFSTSQGQLTPDKDAYSRLFVEFEDFFYLLGRKSTLIRNEKIAAHPEWCVVFSPCHSDELTNTLPANLKNLNGFWDYAVIRLKKPAGLERKWATFSETSIVPKVKDKILVFQHPAGSSLKVDVDEIAPPKPLKPADISSLRFLHYVNSGAGSSGAPCFDKSFTFFGLHQGEWNTSTDRRNRGIPIVQILNHINENKGLPPLDPADNPLWMLKGLEKFTPVLSLVGFQEIVWQSVAMGNPKIMIIGGERGRGKTFCADLLKAMLPDGSNLKIKVSAGVISKLKVEDLVDNLCATAGVKKLLLQPMNDSTSTTTVWLKDEVVPLFINELDANRKGRLVWLTITELNKFEIEGQFCSEFLHMLYEQTLTVDWLRVLLDGMQGDLPQSLRPLTSFVRMTEFTKADIETFYRSAVADMELDLGPLGLKGDVNEAFNDYQQWLNSDSATAAAKLAEKITNRITNYLSLLS